MLKKILLTLAVLVVVFFIIVATRPAEFRVSRSAAIPAPAAVVFEQVNSLHRFQGWSPWAKIDPACKYIYSGPETGVGASYTWAGNQDVGEGRMTIIESKPDELVRFKLEFLKPFAATNTAELSLKSIGDQTEVTWSIYGENNFMMKLFGLFMDFEKMTGADFERGLSNLKSVVTAAGK